MLNTVRRLACALAVLAAAATPALAQPDHIEAGAVLVVPPGSVVVPVQPGPPPGQPAMVAAGAPQNERWDDVSHINGQVVPVGERGNYLHRWKKTNIASNPIGWMFGFYGVSVSTAMSNNVAIRGDVNVFDLDGTTGYEVGASLPIYFKRVYQGPFVEPGLIVRELRNASDACDFDCADAMVGPEVLFGWHWTFDSGLNVAAALGAARDMNKKEESRNENVEPAGYFRIGYAF